MQKGRAGSQYHAEIRGSLPYLRSKLSCESGVMYHVPTSPHATRRRPGTWLVLALLGLGCAEAKLTNGNADPDGGSHGEADAASPVVVLLDALPDSAASGQGDVPCSRTVNLRGVTITRPVPFDVVIVADNSDSLSWSRDSLSAGLKNLLAHVHGHEARFFVLTTTQYGASSQAAVSPITGKDLVSWRDSVSGEAYVNAVTLYEQDCTDGDGAATACPMAPTDINQSWTVKGTWRLAMPSPVAAITSDMDDAEIAVQQQRIADAVLALGGGGSQQEQPVCTLLRYIGQDPASLPKHAVFVVLTDEDDTSPPDVCLAGYEATQQAGLSGSKVACDSDCPEYVYYVNRPNQEERLDFTCVPVDDKGTAHPEQATQKSVVLKTGAKCAVDAGSATDACTDADLVKAGVECGAGTLVQQCTHGCGAGKGYVQCNLSRPDDGTDLCTQAFDQGGVRYANLADYCSRVTGGTGWETCSVMGLKPNTPDGGTYTSRSERVAPLVTAQDTAGMIQAFKSSADSLIGRGNYSVEAIVLDPAFDCPLHSGQSYAANLRSLASSDGDVFALCEDYAPAIERIASFADYLIQTTFPLDLDEYEDVDSVLVTDKQGVQRMVPATSYTYDRVAKLLQFNPGVLTAQDESLAVNVARYCTVVIP